MLVCYYVFNSYSVLEPEVELYVYQVVVVLGQATVVHVGILHVEFQVLREEIVQTALHLVDG